MIWILELTNTRERTKLGKGKCLEFYGNCFQTNHTPPWSNMAANQPDIPPYDTNMSHHTSPSMNQSANEPYMPPYDISISELSMIHQQCMVFLILLGRWLLPKNQFNRLELAQLLLIFVGSGEDIVEFSTETLAVTSVGCDYTLVVVILMFWTLSISQFSIGLPPKTKKTTKSSTAIEQPTMNTFGQLYGHDESAKIAIERRQSMMKLNNRLSKISIKGGINNLETVAEVTTNNEENAVPEGQGKIYGKTRRTLRLPKPTISEEQQTHFKFLYALYRKEVREALLTILLQDFPFLVIRIYVLTIAPLQTSVMFYGLKNIFVIGLHFYRFYALYLEYRKQLRIAPIKEEPPHSSSDGTVKEGAEDGTQRNTNSRRESKSKYELSGSKNCGEK
ncbi:uncharacterized protein [Amphiura filiformis]|uniref:uncharacterized protein n=1 Tax=Amphiura filiformis TaxID=82378 RepID=UPI003B20C9AB